MAAIRAHLSYANVMATVAVFVALGGGAYALTGVPDSSGVYHGCVQKKNGALRVVSGASKCHKARTVRRAHRRVRIPGEAAITWNRLGPPGQPGQPGPGAVKLHFDRAPVDELVTLGTVGAWTIRAQCPPGGASVPSSLQLFIDGPGSADLTDTDQTTGGTPTPEVRRQDLGANTEVFSVGVKGGELSHRVGTMVLSAGPDTPVAQIGFVLIVDNTQPPGHCSFIGTATPAP